jgi:rhamnose transport system permease protein
MSEPAIATATEAQESRAALISEFGPRRSIFQFFRHWEWMMVALLVVVTFLNTRLSPYFLNARNLSRTSSDFMELGIMMLPMVFIIITGNIDLSVASTLGMCASFMGLLFNLHVNIWVAVLAALVLGTLGGLLNGYLVARVKLPSLVVTLGTYAFYRGIAYGFLGDQAATNYPASFTYLGQGLLPHTLVPFSVGLFVVLAVIFGLVLHKTTFGRYLFVIGNNQDAAIFSGVPVARIKITIFMVSGLMSALAGVILASRFGSTRPDIGTGLELAVITAAVLGGVDINGGKGSMLGAVLSLTLIGLIRFGMGLKNIQGQVQGIVIGLLLIGAILLPSLANQASVRRIGWNRRAVLYMLAVILLVALFILFFFWSRQPIISSI